MSQYLLVASTAFVWAGRGRGVPGHGSTGAPDGRRALPRKGRFPTGLGVLLRRPLLPVLRFAVFPDLRHSLRETALLPARLFPVLPNAPDPPAPALLRQTCQSPESMSCASWDCVAGHGSYCRRSMKVPSQVLKNQPAGDAGMRNRPISVAG